MAPRASTPSLAFQPIAVRTGSADEDGQLVLADGRLVAVLVRLSDQHGPDLRGTWFLEVMFGRPGPSLNVTFPDLDRAGEWIARRLAWP